MIICPLTSPLLTNIKSRVVAGFIESVTESYPDSVSCKIPFAQQGKPLINIEYPEINAEIGLMIGGIIIDIIITFLIVMKFSVVGPVIELKSGDQAS